MKHERERADLMTINVVVVVDGKTNLNPNTLWSVYISSHSYLFAHAWNAQKRESWISHYAPINKWHDLKVKSMWKERRERECKRQKVVNLKFIVCNMLCVTNMSKSFSLFMLHEALCNSFSSQFSWSDSTFI